jgi:Skp family chaperone for outer membrane proteins
MNNDIKCPNCGEVFDVENVIAIELEKKFQQDYQDKLNQSLQKVDEEKKKLQDDLLRFEENKKKANDIFTERLKTEKIR